MYRNQVEMIVLPGSVSDIFRLILPKTVTDIIKRRGVQMNLITVEKMASELGSSRDGVYKRIRRGHLPPAMKIGGTICWRKEDWENWLARQAAAQGALVEPLTEPREPPKEKKRKPGRPRQNG